MRGLFEPAYPLLAPLCNLVNLVSFLQAGSLCEDAPAQTHGMVGEPLRQVSDTESAVGHLL
jgi:hypothetical protein